METPVSLRRILWGSSRISGSPIRSAGGHPLRAVIYNLPLSANVTGLTSDVIGYKTRGVLVPRGTGASTVLLN